MPQDGTLEHTLAMASVSGLRSPRSGMFSESGHLPKPQAADRPELRGVSISTPFQKDSDAAYKNTSGTSVLS